MFRRSVVKRVCLLRNAPLFPAQKYLAVFSATKTNDKSVLEQFLAPDHKITVEGPEGNPFLHVKTFEEFGAAARHIFETHYTLLRASYASDDGKAVRLILTAGKTDKRTQQYGTYQIEHTGRFNNQGKIISALVTISKGGGNAGEELIRQVYARFLKGDIIAILDLFTIDSSCEAYGTSQHITTGKHALIEFIHQLLEAYTIEGIDVVECYATEDAKHVFTTGVAKLLEKSTQKHIEHHFQHTWVLDVVAGKVRQVRMNWSQHDAQ